MEIGKAVVFCWVHPKILYDTVLQVWLTISNESCASFLDHCVWLGKVWNWNTDRLLSEMILALLAILDYCLEHTGTHIASFHTHWNIGHVTPFNCLQDLAMPLALCKNSCCTAGLYKYTCANLNVSILLLQQQSSLCGQKRVGQDKSKQPTQCIFMSILLIQQRLEPVPDTSIRASHW